jgi:nitrite reductase/ring-hydroxylating ferredoxin subunit
MAGGYLGGHLSYVLGIGVDHTAFEQPPSEWTDVAAVDDLTAGTPKRVDVDGAAILLLAREDGIHAIGAVCPHLGGPLDEGEIEGDTVTCPWHGSVFCISDGSLQHGPSATAVTAYDVMTESGRVYVREAKAGATPGKGRPQQSWQERMPDVAPPPTVDDWVESISPERQSP